jgi:hypothetical protein
MHIRMMSSISERDMESCIKQHAGGRTFSCLSLATDIFGYKVQESEQ